MTVNVQRMIMHKHTNTTLTFVIHTVFPWVDPFFLYPTFCTRLMLTLYRMSPCLQVIDAETFSRLQNGNNTQAVANGEQTSGTNGASS